jgi:thiosulfate/3-mercaptopyruvate sulfurtransferase
MIPPFVDVDFLVSHPQAVIADVRWYLDGRDGKEAYAAGHIPGALWVDLDHDLSAVGRPATAGRHPFPTADDFAEAMASFGIGDDTIVVAYDDNGGANAARMAVMLRMVGHDAAVLAGGLAAWQGPIETGAGAQPRRATFTPRPWPADRFAEADDVARAADAHAPILDARSYERFTGSVASIDKRAGHIPGAKSAHWSAVLDEGGMPREPDELRAYYEFLGVEQGDDAVAYCGSGVSACMNVLGMERAGLRPPRLYVASWSGWSADPGREAATGD